MFRLLLVAALVTAFAPSAGATDHPVLEALEVELAELPSEPHLLRTSRALPRDLEFTVHAKDGALHLVTATPQVLGELAKRGFNPIPLRSGAVSPLPATRAWKRVPEPDPRIQSLVDSVDWSNLRAKIAKLQNFGTRFAMTSQCAAAADTLHAFFQRQGLDVEFHAFDHNGMTHRNVVATQLGETFPDSVFVVGAHYDSTSEAAFSDAPGADDNASGTAAVQMVAQLLAPHTFDYTIKYVCFTAEEVGIVGSSQFANDAQQSGMNIVGMLNFDMLGFWTRGTDFDLEIESNQASVWLMDAITNAADLYTTMTYETHVNDAAWWGDHASFWANGFAAVNHEEAYDWADPDFNIHYHTTRDLLTFINQTFMVGNTQIAVAAVATLARMAEPVATETPSMSGFKARFRGN